MQDNWNNELSLINSCESPHWYYLVSKNAELQKKKKGEMAHKLSQTKGNGKKFTQSLAVFARKE